MQLLCLVAVVGCLLVPPAQGNKVRGVSQPWAPLGHDHPARGQGSPRGSCCPALPLTSPGGQTSRAVFSGAGLGGDRVVHRISGSGRPAVESTRNFVFGEVMQVLHTFWWSRRGAMSCCFRENQVIWGVDMLCECEVLHREKLL